MSNAGGAWDNAKKWVEKCAKESDHGSFTNYGIKKGSVFDKAFNAEDNASVLNFSPVAASPEAAKAVAAHLNTDFAVDSLRQELLELYHNRHSAVVNGDTVGDPFKDTSGPALNILIKLMSVISLVLAPAFRDLNEHNGFGTNGSIIAIITFIVVTILSIVFVMRVNSANQRDETELETQLNKQKLLTWIKEAEARAVAVQSVEDADTGDAVETAVAAIADAAVPALVAGVAGVTGVSPDGGESTEAESIKLRVSLLSSLLPAIESKLGLSLGASARADVITRATAIVEGRDEPEADAAAAAAGVDAAAVAVEE
jgi:Na+/H+-translocating membrane pyrophosphatase